LITTTRVTHATPAGFVAHIKDRNLEDEIALQYLEFQPDVVLGGGSRHFDPGKRADGRDLFSEFASKGYSIARTTDEVKRLGGSKVLGAFTSSHLPFEIDRVHQGLDGPSLAQITRKGLQLLSGAPNGFVAQVEAGRIDHANHNNDPAAMVWDVLAADETLDVILNFVDQNPETLLILASDHGTAGGAVYGVGENYHQASSAFDTITTRRASYEFLFEKAGASPDPAVLVDLVAEYLGTKITLDDAKLVADAIQGNTRMDHSATYHEQPANSLGWVTAEVEDYDKPQFLNINYSAGQHTAGPVPIALYGAGTSGTQLGLVDITDAFEWMCSAIGVQHQNPIMSEEEALGVLAGLNAATGTDG
jgi:alkaline phosphatase